MKIRIVERIITEASRKNIVDTLTNRIKSILARFYVENELDPNKEGGYEIDLTQTMANLQNLSKKFSNPVTKLIFKHTPTWRNPEDTAYYSGKNIFVYIPFGYDTEEFSVYLEVKKKKADPAKFEEEVNKIIEKNKAGKGFKSNTRPEFTQSTKINKFNLDQLKKAFPIYKTPDYVDNIIKLCTPGSKERNKYIYSALNKTSSSFSTLFHEVAHGKQHNITGSERVSYEKTKPETNLSSRILQLNSFFLDENLPLMSLNNYVSNIQYFDPASRREELGKFFYYSRPLEIDARLKQARLFYRNKRKEDPKTAAEELFNHVKSTEEYYASTINVSAYYRTAELATEELRSKYLHQFYYQMSKDAKDIFSLNPKFQEEFDYYKNKVQDLNNKIKMSPSVGNTADDRQRSKYRNYISRDPEDLPKDDSQN